MCVFHDVWHEMFHFVDDELLLHFTVRIYVKLVSLFRNGHIYGKEYTFPKVFKGSEMASAMSGMLHILCNFLSVTVIITCLVLKVPQIFTVFKQKSSKGLSINSVLLELCA